MARKGRFPLLLGLAAVLGSVIAAPALAADAADWAPSGGGGGIGWSDSAGLGSAALGDASIRTTLPYARAKSTYVPCMRWETVWDPFPFFGYRRVRVPC